MKLQADFIDQFRLNANILIIICEQNLRPTLYGRKEGFLDFLLLIIYQVKNKLWMSNEYPAD